MCVCVCVCVCVVCVCVCVRLLNLGRVKVRIKIPGFSYLLISEIHHKCYISYFLGLHVFSFIFLILL